VPDLEIRGAGPVGCTLALALHRSGRAVRVVEKRTGEAPPGAAPLRPIALSHASRLILERVGAWRAIAPTPIETIRVSQAGVPGRTALSAADAGVPALGYVIEYHTLGAALRAQLDARAIVCATAPGRAPLVVHAEGAASDAREKPYPQEAVLALLETRPAATSLAHERFTSGGPIALLPLAGRYALVWSAPPGRARQLCEAAPETFLEALAAAVGRRPGEFIGVSRRGRVPLALRVRRARTGDREAFIGNAAQTLHPVAGQGLNLGLRDAWDLARVLQDAPDPGDARLLACFAASRRLDAAATIGLTDLLAVAFAEDRRLARFARAAALGAAMTALDACAPLRRFFARRMIYGPSAIP
jgi:2-octaprenyl-6-methoxyphenol hydroxylase